MEVPPPPPRISPFHQQLSRRQHLRHYALVALAKSVTILLGIDGMRVGSRPGDTVRNFLRAQTVGAH